MCVSAEVSLITFISSAIMCTYLWYRNNDNDRAISLWIFAFSLIQLLEFFMWIDMKNHTIAAKLSLIFILAQPLVLALALVKLGTIYENTMIKYLLYGFIALATVKVLYTIYYAFYVDRDNKWLSVKGDNCHLVWYYIRNEEQMPLLTRINLLYYLPLILTCLCIKPFPLGVMYALFGIITFNFSSYYYGIEYGSIWCWIANAMGIFAIASKYVM
jgi:hypothetical protein